MGRGGWIDVSVPLSEGLVHWPENPPFKIRRVKDMAQGGSSNVSEISMGTHAGTHLDAPVHFLPGGPAVDSFSLEVAIGPARVLEIRDGESVKAEELRSQRIKIGERILLKTKNSSRPWAEEPFKPHFVYLSTEAADFLASKKPKLLGIDYLSIGGYKKNGRQAHEALLKAGAWVLEGLDLSRVRAGVYEMICLPLKISGADGAPARVLLKRS